MTSERPTFVLDGETLAFEPGETILAVARRVGLSIPTLCDDPRLDPVGVCRMCLVEIDGWRRLAPSCATAIGAGMVVRTGGERIERHRRALLGLYLTDHPPDGSACADAAPCRVHELAREARAPTNWEHLRSIRAAGGDHSKNPYILFRADRCIACAQCVRYCDEVEGVTAIGMVARGAATSVSTADGISLIDSTCEMCGGCIDVCPTGAMTERVPIERGERPERELTKVRTTCNYCGVGCQLDLNVDPAGNDGRGRVVKVTSPPPGTLPNDGNLCVKGRFAYQFMDHPDRLSTPLVRGSDGELHEASWDEALTCAARGLRDVEERHGADALAFVSSSRCTMEENYLVQKLARAVFSTNNVHQCAAT